MARNSTLGTTRTPILVQATPVLGRLRLAYQHWIIRRRAFRQTWNELAGLSDRELAGLGLNRGLIPRLAREAADKAVETR